MWSCVTNWWKYESHQVRVRYNMDSPDAIKESTWMFFQNLKDHIYFHKTESSANSKKHTYFNIIINNINIERTIANWLIMMKCFTVIAYVFLFFAAATVDGSVSTGILWVLRCQWEVWRTHSHSAFKFIKNFVETIIQQRQWTGVTRVTQETLWSQDWRFIQKVQKWWIADARTQERRQKRKNGQGG